MSELNQEDFQKAKAALDKAIKITSRLAGDAVDAMNECCRADALDTRDQFAMLASDLRAAESKLLSARSIGGQIAGNGITRSGGT